jgi:glycosyltransferase involved in cell wall biosynthesis
MNLPKKILMTADTIGGVWTYSVELCRALEAREIEVALCTMGRKPTDAQLDELAPLENTTLFPSEFRLEWMPDPWEDVEFAGNWLLDIADEFQPDLIHLNTYAHGALPWGAPTLIVAHSCVFSWWQAVHNSRPPREWNTYHRYVESGLLTADKIIAPSQAMLDEIERIYHVTGNCDVIPNGIARAASNDAAKKDYIFSAGRLWDEAKNISLLAQISERLAWPVYTAGKCEGEDGSTAPTGKLKCLGELSRNDVAIWQQTASIYAAPAKYEPFGLAILEAASAGCALVLGDIPSLRENWDGAAEFCDPRDSLAWIETLNRLSANPKRRAELGALARERSKEFTIERTARAYLAAYSQLVSASQTSPAAVMA